MSKPDLAKSLKNVSDKDRAQIEQAQAVRAAIDSTRAGVVDPARLAPLRARVTAAEDLAGARAADVAEHRRGLVLAALTDAADRHAVEGEVGAGV